MTYAEVMVANGAQPMPDFDKTTDKAEEPELVDVGVKINSELKETLQDHVRENNDGRIRGVYRNRVEDLFVLGNYLYDKDIEPQQAIERLEVYENLMPIEAELKKLGETVDLTEDIEGELASLNRNVEQIRYDIISQQNEKFNRQNAMIEEMEDETVEYTAELALEINSLNEQISRQNALIEEMEGKRAEDLAAELESLNENLQQIQENIIAQQDEMFRQQNSRLDRLEYAVVEAFGSMDTDEGAGEESDSDS